MTPWLTLSLGLLLGQTPPGATSLPPDADTQDLGAQQQEAAARIALVEQELLGIQERAQQQELLRTQRLAQLEDAGVWMLAADQALAVGELDIGDALDEADAALADALENATETGNGRTVLLIENIRTRLAFALEATGRRSVYEARWALYDASWELREARRQALNRPDTAVLTQ